MSILPSGLIVPGHRSSGSGRADGTQFGPSALKSLTPTADVASGSSSHRGLLCGLSNNASIKINTLWLWNPVGKTWTARNVGVYTINGASAEINLGPFPISRVWSGPAWQSVSLSPGFILPAGTSQFVLWYNVGSTEQYGVNAGQPSPLLNSAFPDVNIQAITTGITNPTTLANFTVQANVFNGMDFVFEYLN